MAQRVLQLLRSSNTFLNFDAAKSAIEAIQNKKDGEIVLARYGTGTPTGDPGSEVAAAPFFSAIGVYDAGHTKWTVFKSSDEIEAAIQALQDELDDTQEGAGLGDDGSYTAPVSGEAGYEVLGGQDAPESLYEAIMALADAIAAMDHTNNYTAATTGNDPVPAHATDASKVISGVNQANGVLDTVTTDAVDLLLTGYANDGTTHTGAISASDTVETALNKLENATSAGVQLSEKSGNQIARLSDNPSTTDVDEAGLYSHVEIAKLTDQEVTALSDANVREAYKLIDANGRTAIGDVIKIYKDSSLQSVYLGHVDDTLTHEDSTTHESADTTVTSGTGSEALCFIYHLENGNYKLVAVDLESFLQESEFGDGLQVNNHVVSVNAGDGLDFDSSDPKKVIVKKDSSSQQVYTAASTPAADVLTVGANGVKVANVQAAINFATDQVLSTTVASSDEAMATANTPHISISESTDDTTGLHSYSVSESDIASEDLVNAITGQTLGSAMTYSGTPTYIGQAQTNTFSSDLAALDAAVADNLKSVSGSNAINVAAKDANKDQAISLILDDSTVGTGTELTGDYNALSVTNDGLFLSNIWDCGQY